LRAILSAIALATAEALAKAGHPCLSKAETGPRTAEGVATLLL